MLPELVVAVVMVALDSGVLNGAVHSLDLAVGPRMPRLGQAMFDVEVGTRCFKGVAPDGLVLRSHRFDVFGRPAVSRRVGEMRPVVGQHGVDLVRQCGCEMLEEVGGYPARRLLVQLDESELRCSVDRHEEI